jgi:hypothetical protein
MSEKLTRGRRCGRTFVQGIFVLESLARCGRGLYMSPSLPGSIGSIPVIVNVISQTPSTSLTSPDLLHLDETITKIPALIGRTLSLGLSPSMPATS